MKVRITYKPLIEGLDVTINPTSLTEYFDELEKALKSFGHTVLKVSVNRGVKTNQLNEVLQQLLLVGDSFGELEFAVDETKLLAINTMISASQCGWQGESFATIVKQVNTLCNQSHQFLKDVKRSFKVSHDMLEKVLQMIEKTVFQEVNAVASLRSQLDILIGKLKTHEVYLEALAINTLAINRAANSVELSWALDLMRQDWHLLKECVYQCQRYLLKMKHTYKNFFSQDSDLICLMERLEFLLTAEIDIKNDAVSNESSQFSLC